MPFFTGERVICVNDSEPPQGNPPYVIKGRHYTISQTVTRVFFGHEVQFVFVAELPAPEGIGWYAARFRKLVSKDTKTDISEFKEILNKTTVKVPEKT